MTHKKASSSLTSKFQATVPDEIRDDNTVLLRKTSPLNIDYLNGLIATLSEWTSEEDHKAYNNLSSTLYQNF